MIILRNVGDIARAVYDDIDGRLLPQAVIESSRAVRRTNCVSELLPRVVADTRISRLPHTELRRAPASGTFSSSLSTVSLSAIVEQTKARGQKQIEGKYGMAEAEHAESYSLAEFRERLDLSQDLPFSLAFAKRDVTVVLYKPQDPDRQTPHPQDEFYFVAAGKAALHVGDEEALPLDAGDIAFVPAGRSHRFSGTSADFLCWAFFFGETI